MKLSIGKYLPSRSQRALDRILSIGGPPAERIKTGGIHPTKLSMYRRARARPNADTIALLAKLSGGEVEADGWVVDHSGSDTSAHVEPHQ